MMWLLGHDLQRVDKVLHQASQLSDKQLGVSFIEIVPQSDYGSYSKHAVSPVLCDTVYTHRYRKCFCSVCMTDVLVTCILLLSSNTQCVVSVRKFC